MSGSKTVNNNTYFTIKGKKIHLHHTSNFIRLFEYYVEKIQKKKTMYQGTGKLVDSFFRNIELQK